MILGWLLMLVIGLACFGSWPSSQNVCTATTSNEDSDIYFDYFIIDEMID